MARLLCSHQPLAPLAASERDGKTLWRMPLNTTIKTSPMTYTVGGRQFVALAAGSSIFAFALPD